MCARRKHCVLVSWHRFGPYHHARLRGAARKLPVVGLEISNLDKVYAWKSVEGCAAYETLRLFTDVDVATVSSRELLRRTARVIGELSPSAVVVQGWGGRPAYALAAAAWRHNVPCVVMSDSTAIDSPRWRHIERIKGRVISTFDAALVGGVRQAQYIASLGMPAERVFMGYDAVDNAHFERGARAIEADRDHSQQVHDVPAAFFLASARFVEKKNLFHLFDAYARYRGQAGADAWSRAPGRRRAAPATRGTQAQPRPG